MEQIFERVILNYPDIIRVFVIPMIIAIFTLTFPLLFQVMSRIDDKYDSTLLIKAFRKEKITKCFIVFVPATIISCLVWILQKERCVDWGESINGWIDNSALILLVGSTFALIISTIVIMVIMYEYYVPEKLFNRLKKNYKNCNEKDKPMFFMAISKVMQYAIKKSDVKLSYDTLQFFIKKFSEFIGEKKNKTCEYPEEYYMVIRETNEIIFMNPQKGTSFFDESIMLRLLINESPIILSEKTYKELWTGLKQALYYNNENFIISYWQQAHQYMELRLSKLGEKGNERERFLELQYALGGLLMMMKKYTLIKQLIFWTNQDPPKYVLVPETMGEVIQMFMYIESDKNNRNPVYYEQKYPSSDINNIFANDVIKMWIQRYIAVLFLRQYILPECFINIHRLEIPNNLPQTPKEKQKWIEKLDILKEYVSEYLFDKTLLITLGLNKLAEPDWLKNNNKPHPNELIKKLIGELKR